jgi:hypothetical protein
MYHMLKTFLRKRFDRFKFRGITAIDKKKILALKKKEKRIKKLIIVIIWITSKKNKNLSIY